MTTALLTTYGDTYDEWLEIGRTLITEHVQRAWEIGDWYNYGERRYGDRIKIAATLGLSPHTLRFYSYTAAHVESVRRSDALPFGTHREVARLEPAEQTAILEQAAEHSWGVRETRAAVLEQYPPKPTANVRAQSIVADTLDKMQAGDARRAEEARRADVQERNDYVKSILDKWRAAAAPIAEIAEALSHADAVARFAPESRAFLLRMVDEHAAYIDRIRAALAL
jgi:hypothetical protein